MKMHKNSSPGWAIAIVVLFSGMVNWFHWFSILDTAHYDFLIQRNFLEYPDDVVIVAIDEASIERLGAWPWSRDLHAQLLKRLELADAVVFDLIFAEPQSMEVKPVDIAVNLDAQSSLGAADQSFLDAIKANKNVILPLYIERQNFKGALREILPIPEFSAAAAALGHAHVEYSENGIARGLYLREGLGSPYWPHLSLALVKLLGEQQEVLPGVQSPIESDRSQYIIYRDYFNWLRFIGPPNTIYQLSYIDVLDGLIPSDQWRGKRVFVGATAKGLGDEVPTPVGALSGVEFHANAYQAVRVNGFVTTPGRVLHTSLTMAVVLFCTMFLSRLAPAQFLLMVSASLLGLVITTLGLFLMFSYWFSSIAAILALALFYPLWSWRRIEMALLFLQEELAKLKSGPDRSSFSLSEVEVSLQGLVHIGLFDRWSLERDPLMGPISWPALEELTNGFVTGFMCREGGYRLTIEGTLNRGSIEPILSALLASASSAYEAPASSYELVEKTIKEIYSVKEIADKVQQRMNKSMAQLQDAVLVADAAGKIVFTNEKFQQIFSTGLEGKSVAELKSSHSSHAWMSILRTLMVEQESVYQELELSNGQRYLCQAAIIDGTEDSEQIANISSMVGNQKTLVFVFTDVTRLRYLERSKNEALAFLSHDMRSPIVSLLSLIETYRIKHAGLAPATIEFINQLDSFARKNLKYSEDFLQLSRAENIDDQIFQLVDVHGVIDGAYSQVHGLAQARNVKILIERVDEDCWVSGDPQLLERAVMNVLSNAIQYTPSGKCVRLILGIQQGIQIIISDEGSGIPEDMLPHLFEPYFRARNKIQQLVRDSDLSAFGMKGYGLGLSFVHTVVKKHGGTVKVNSTLGEGSTFILSFPATTVD